MEDRDREVQDRNKKDTIRYKGHGGIDGTKR